MLLTDIIRLGISHVYKSCISQSQLGAQAGMVNSQEKEPSISEFLPSTEWCRRLPVHVTLTVLDFPASALTQL